ncbi:MAG TPA: TIR domain-containing protein [Pyrinomonadaceae bacterium]|nr:TIR domain-containing protein [Pyrinomonadaceae bacterium]
MKILLVEDDVFFAQAITEYLADNGIDTLTTKSTQDALSENLIEYDAAVIDVMLPNDPALSGISSEESRAGYLAGVALARRLRIKKSDFPIILLSAGVGGGEARQWARDQGHPFVLKDEKPTRLLSALADLGLAPKLERPRAFIVHGHDEALLAELKDYLQNTLKWPEPIVLRDQPNNGKTLIEKFEEHAGFADWVFVLISPDDRAFDPKTNDDKRRARQNVIFEFGFFYGLLGRKEGRVIALKKGDVQLPSDIQGIVWIDVSAGVRAAGEEIRKEVVSKGLAK